MPRTTTLFALVCAFPVVFSPSPVVLDAQEFAPGKKADGGWISLFNGKDLSGWRISENGKFRVEDGVLVVSGKRAHMFTKREFKDFDFTCEVMTTPGSNSGVYFHTKYAESWPSAGYEVQVNCTHRDPVKNGSLWGIAKSFDPIAKDNEWFTMQITVRGKHIVTRVNGKVVIDYTEPEGVTRPRRVGKGSMAIQAHDPRSVIRYRNIRIKPLPPSPTETQKPDTASRPPRQAEYTYKSIGERKLLMHVHYPSDWKATDRRPVIVFFFGGGWTGGKVTQFQTQAEYFATRGLVAARADYRVRSRDNVTPDKCVEDARSAVRWLRANAKQLGIDPHKLIASGGSAGGHLAACTMIKKSVEADGDDLSISTVPQAMVLFNPVLSFMHERMISRLDGNEELAKKISPTFHLQKKAPPALILFGTKDRLKVFGDAYWKKAADLGARADKYLAEGQGHGFFNRSPWRERTLIAADKFLASLGYLKGAPTIKEPK